MENFTFDSDDLGATEEFLISAYTSMSIANDTPGRAGTHVRRRMLGPVSLDRLNLGFDMSYQADPLGKVCLCLVHEGSIEENYHDSGLDVFRPGEVGLLTPPELPYSGVIRSAHYSITMFDPAVLQRVGATLDMRDPVRFDGHRPVSPTAGRHLAGVIEHLQRVAADTDAAAHPLIAATAADYLAATVLETLPTTAVTEPNAADRNDARPETLRRAVAYIESHLREDIAVGDIARAACVTPRALQLAFRRHLDCTPVAYVRRLRLAAAHESLLAADPARHTVTDIAFEWGFSHPGRFAVAYRRAYGRTPGSTLHS